MSEPINIDDLATEIADILKLTAQERGELLNALGKVIFQYHHAQSTGCGTGFVAAINEAEKVYDRATKPGPVGRDDDIASTQYPDHRTTG